MKWMPRAWRPAAKQPRFSEKWPLFLGTGLGALSLVRRRRRRAPRLGLILPAAVIPALFFGVASGAFLMFIFDPAMGRRRRAMVRDRFGASVRDAARGVGRAARGTAAGAYGISQKVIHLVPRRALELDEVTLARKVESILFRDPDVPKGQINIDVADGVVFLRGELDRPEQIEALEMVVRRVPGVRDVENLLHLPGTTPRNKEAAREVG